MLLQERQDFKIAEKEDKVRVPFIYYNFKYKIKLLNISTQTMEKSIE
jgi:hypothetical protein